MTRMGNTFPKRAKGTSRFLLTVVLVILSPLMIAAVVLYVLWGALLYLAIWLTWRGQIVIFVYSHSPTWKEYIETEILPYLPGRAVILNWSERRNWKNSLPVLAFHYFGGYRNYNPMGMVFRPFHSVKTYRFFTAFQEFKQGKPQRVEEVKRELFRRLGL